MLVHPPKARPGDRIAVLSPSFAAAGAFPAVHEQAMRRLADITGLVPVEYPTTRQVGAPPSARARDINAAFADPQIRGILAVVGGEDQITVIPHLDADLMRVDPKPFLGTSDNTNLHHWLWVNGVASFHGGSSQVHLGAGPGVDDIHARSLRAALLTGETLEITDPGESEDIGVPWDDPRALTSFGDRDATDPWSWYGPPRSVTGRTWGGCLEVIEWIMTAGRFPRTPASWTAACCSSKPRKSSCPRGMSDGSSAHWVNGESSAPSMPSWSPAHRCPTSPDTPPPRNGHNSGPSNVMSSSISCTGTTPWPSSAWASRSVTPGRNGSSPTADRSPSTARHSGFGPTTAEPWVAAHDRMSQARARVSTRRSASQERGPNRRTRCRCRQNERFRLAKHRNGLFWCESRIAPHTLIDMLQ